MGIRIEGAGIEVGIFAVRRVARRVLQGVEGGRSEGRRQNERRNGRVEMGLGRELCCERALLPITIRHESQDIHPRIIARRESVQISNMADA